MTKHVPKSNLGLTALYFVLSMLAPWPIAWELAQARVQAAGISNFEGASGLAVVMQTPAWAMLLMLGTWIAYFFMRSNDALLWSATFALAIPSLVLIGHGIELLL